MRWNILHQRPRRVARCPMTTIPASPPNEAASGGSQKNRGILLLNIGLYSTL